MTFFTVLFTFLLAGKFHKTRQPPSSHEREMLLTPANGNGGMAFLRQKMRQKKPTRTYHAQHTHKSLPFHPVRGIKCQDCSSEAI